MMRKAAERNRVLEAAWIFLAVIFLDLVIGYSHPASRYSAGAR